MSQSAHQAELAVLANAGVGALFQAFLQVDEAARQGPIALIRRRRPLHQQDLQCVPADGEKHDIDGDGRMWVAVGIGHVESSCEINTNYSVLIKCGSTPIS